MSDTLATGAGLIALVLTFGPVSGAHFNPAVTLPAWRLRMPTHVADQSGAGLAGWFDGVAVIRVQHDADVVAPTIFGVEHVDFTSWVGAPFTLPFLRSHGDRAQDLILDEHAALASLYRMRG